MAARSPSDAFRLHVAALDDVLRYVTAHRHTIPARTSVLLDVDYAVALSNLTPVPILGVNRLTLSIGQRFRNFAAPDIPRFRSITTGYFYGITSLEARDLFHFHWTPHAIISGAITTPHMHVGSVLFGDQRVLMPGTLHKTHIPTGTVSVADVVRFLIVELGARPLRANWESVLAQVASEDWSTSAS